jgi:murein DD-endopeptidase MepM/ murein hydrolase activator NlpD
MLPYLDPKEVRLTQPYGVPGNYAAGFHTGIDLVSDGDKRIFPICGGEVIRSRLYGDWGNYVVIRQHDGLYCVYAHMKTRMVEVGQTVGKTKAIGIEGSTGNSTGSHLHIELQKKYYDPFSTINIADYLGIKNEVGPVEEIDLLESSVKILQQKGIISSPDYWLTNARIGKTVSGENARSLIIKMAEGVK